MTDKLSEDTVSTRIPRWLKEELKEAAKQRLTSMSQIVREAIVGKLWDDEAQRQLRQAQEDEAKQAVRSDDAEL